MHTNHLGSYPNAGFDLVGPGRDSSCCVSNKLSDELTLPVLGHTLNTECPHQWFSNSALHENHLGNFKKMQMPRLQSMLIKSESLGTIPKARIVFEVPQVILMFSQLQTSAAHPWFPHFSRASEFPRELAKSNCQAAAPEFLIKEVLGETGGCTLLISSQEPQRLLAGHYCPLRTVALHWDLCT